MFGKKRQTEAELLVGMEERIRLRFREFENARLIPFQRRLIENFNDALISQMGDGGIDPETLEDEFLESDEMPEWMDIARTLGKHDHYGQWFNEQYDRLTNNLLFNGTKVVGDIVLRDNLSPDGPEWN